MSIDYHDVWKDFCFQINKKKSVTEAEFQYVFERLFDKLGWSDRRGELVPQYPVRFGSASTFHADIVIKDDKEVFYVVELKRPGLPMSEEYVKQLCSYMRQLNTDFGVFICDALRIYYDKKQAIKICDIPFTDESKNGAEVLSILAKENFSLERLKKYSEDMLQETRIAQLVEDKIKDLCFVTGKEILTQLLKEKLQEELPSATVEKIFETIDICVTKKVFVRPIDARAVDDENDTDGNINSRESMTKRKALKLCKEHGIDVFGNVTYASKTKNTNKYWANPGIKLLSDDWWILLNDFHNGNLHIFKVPAGYLLKSRLKLRSDNKNLIDLQINYDDNSFEDSRSGVKFENWHIKTISYSKIEPRTFFVHLKEFISQNNIPVTVTLSDRQWCRFYSGRIEVLAELLENDNKIRIGFYFNNAHTFFDELFKRKQEIESALGISMNWKRTTEKSDSVSRIETYIHDISESKVADCIINFVRVFDPIFTELNVTHKNDRVRYGKIR